MVSVENTKTIVLTVGANTSIEDLKIPLLIERKISLTKLIQFIAYNSIPKAITLEQVQTESI